MAARKKKVVKEDASLILAQGKPDAAEAKGVPVIVDNKMVLARSLYQDAWKPDNPDIAFEALSKGASIAEVAAALCVSKGTLHTWLDTESPRFRAELADAFQMGMTNAEAFWDSLARQGMTRKDFNVQLYRLIMLTRFQKGGDSSNKPSGSIQIKLNT